MNILIANLKSDIPILNDDDETLLLKSRFETLHFPIGLGILATILKKEGYTIETYDSYIHGIELFYEKVTQMKPDVIMMTGYLGNYFYRFIKKVSKLLKQISPSSILLLGGPGASTIPKLFIDNTDIDYVCMEEGEELIVELLAALQGKYPVEEVKSVYYRNKNDQSCFTGVRDRFDKLSVWPDYDAFPIKKYIEYLNKTGRCWEISASRGCTNRCKFCKHGFQSKTTFYPIPEVIQHMQYVYDTYEIKRFNFLDDNFLFSKNRITKFLSALEAQNYDFEWRCIGRADGITVELISAMKERGLFGIGFGIESGSQKMLDVYKKRINIQKAKEKLLQIRKFIDFHASSIIGGPGENWGTIEETVKFIDDLELFNTSIAILTVFPGTQFYDDAIEQGLIQDQEAYCDNLGLIYRQPYINMSDLTDEELFEARRLIYKTAQKYGEYV